MIWFFVATMSVAAFQCVLSASTSHVNVKDNHRLFSGKIPHPAVFGLTGYVPLSTVPAEGDEDLKTYPDLANAEGTGSHADFTWKLHGIPSYVYTSFNLTKADLANNNYRIVESVNLKDDSDAIGSGQYKIVRAGAPALEKRLDCGGQETPPTDPGSPTPGCHTNHAATLEDCQPLYYLMRKGIYQCRTYDRGGRTFGTYRSCGLVAQRGRHRWQCTSFGLIAAYGLPIINGCWPRDVPNACTNWMSGVIEGTDNVPKVCACNNESVGKC